MLASPVVPLPPVAPAPSTLDTAVDAAVSKIKAAKRPIVWAGVELQRFHVEDTFASLIDASALPFATSLLGKSVLSEDNPHYIGVYEGKSSNVGVQPLVQNSDCLIGLGILTTDINLLGITGVTGDSLTGVVPWSDQFILAANDAVRVGTQYFA